MSHEGTTENPPLPQVPDEHLESATRVYWWMKGLRDPLQIALSALLTVCVTIYTAHEKDEWLSFPAAWWGIAVVMVGALWLAGVVKWFKPTYAEIARGKATAEQRIIALEAGFEEKLSQVRQDGYDELKRTQQAHTDALAEHRQALQGALDDLVAALHEHICGDAVNTRVSVYSVEDDEFVLLARYSRNGLLATRGRNSYPLNQGVIGEAWQNISVIVDEEDVADRVAWEESLTTRGFEQSEAAKLTMFARSIYAERLDHAHAKAGMIVFECLLPSQFTGTTVNKLRRSYLQKTLAAVVAASHGFFPRVNERRAERSATASVVPEANPWKPVAIRDAETNS